jgi:hypothetical protein
VDEGTVTEVRLAVYRLFLEAGTAPSVAEVAAATEISQDEVAEAFRALGDSRVLVFEPGTLDIWMANPLSARPTGYRVTTGCGSWWGTCIWDAFGIPAMLGEDGVIATSDPGTGEPFELRIENGELVPAEAIAHFSVPAGRWWDDIGYT